MATTKSKTPAPIDAVGEAFAKLDDLQSADEQNTAAMRDAYFQVLWRAAQNRSIDRDDSQLSMLISELGYDRQRVDADLQDLRDLIQHRQTLAERDERRTELEATAEALQATKKRHERELKDAELARHQARHMFGCVGTAEAKIDSITFRHPEWFVDSTSRAEDILLTFE